MQNWREQEWSAKQLIANPKKLREPRNLAKMNMQTRTIFWVNDLEHDSASRSQRPAKPWYLRSEITSVIRQERIQRLTRLSEVALKAVCRLHARWTIRVALSRQLLTSSPDFLFVEIGKVKPSGPILRS